VKREAYLASDNTDTLVPSCASRFTNKRSGSAIAAEMFMNKVDGRLVTDFSLGSEH
jgi:hypothetical protein